MTLGLFLALLSPESMPGKVISPGAWVGSEEGKWERLAMGCTSQSLAGSGDLTPGGSPACSTANKVPMAVLGSGHTLWSHGNPGPAICSGVWSCAQTAPHGSESRVVQAL